MVFHTASGKRPGFTLIELLVVMAIIATLLTLALPRYFASLERAREAVLRENLAIAREALDRHYADRGAYPDSLQDLVERKYLRALPVDPITESDASWALLPPADPEQGAVYDLRSGAPGAGRNGVPYAEW